MYDENIEETKILAELLMDENNDGAIDKIVSVKKDGCGRVSAIYFDYNGDNEPDYRILIEYSHDGRIYKIYKDKNLDGKIDSIQIFEYNSDGTKTIHYDDNADGNVDFIEQIYEDGSTTLTDVRSFKQKLKDSIKEFLS